MFKRSLITLALAGVFACTTGHTAPANPFPIAIEQPDGTMFYGYNKGDEVQGWVETLHGYTVVQNPTTQFFEYAVTNPDGQLQPSGIAVAGYIQNGYSADPNLPFPKHAKPPKNLDNLLSNETIARHFKQQISEYQIGVGWTPAPVSGTKKVLTVLVGFNNAPISSGSMDYWSRMIYDTSSNSVAKFYQDNSFGTMSIVPVAHTQPNNNSKVVAVNVPYNHPNCKQSCSSATESQWVTAAMTQVASYVDFASIDTNNDGVIASNEVTVYFIVGGYEASVNSTASPSIWAHASGGNSVTFRQFTLSRWAVNGEKYNSSSFMPIGVITHELGHAIANLPDLYDTAGVNSGLGAFSAMSSGSWGRASSSEIAGTTPTNLDAWSREYLGWSSPIEITQTQTVPLRDSLTDPSAGIKLINRTVKSTEYWLIENRTPTGWDRGLVGLIGYWSGGLLIQHIDSTIGTWANNSFNKYVTGSHQGNLVEQASTTKCNLMSNSQTYGCTSLLFSSGVNFTNTTTPSTKYYTGADSGFGVTNIDPPGALMYATVTRGSSITPLPQNATISAVLDTQGLGSIQFAPNSTTCTSNCSVTYPTGTTITISVYPYSGNQFTGWSGACTGSGSTCTFKLTTNSSVVAYFSKLSTRLLTVSKNGSGTISLGSGILCGNQCTTVSVTASNQALNLTATPNIGYKFSGWSGNCTGMLTTCTIPAGTTSVNAAATFIPLSTPTITPQPTTEVSTTLINYSNTSSATGVSRWHAVRIPQGTRRLVVNTSGGSGNPDVYVAYNSSPSVTNYSCKSTNSSTTEQCAVLNPNTTGTYYIMLRATGAYSGVKLTVRAIY